MDDAREVRQQLVERIAARRAGLAAYLRAVRPRRNRLVDLGIVASAATAVLTAGPALGGVPFDKAATTAVGLPAGSHAWRFLCLAALVTSLLATIATNMARSQDLAARVAAAEAANAALEGLETSLRFGRIPVDDAVDLYQQHVARIPFVDEVAPG
jgi:hypothetical protein